MRLDILPVLDQPAADCLLEIGCTGSELWQPIDDILNEMKAIELVQNDHVEWGRGRSLFLVSSDMQIFVVGSPVGQPVDQPGISVECEDDRFVLREERIEV